MKFKNLKKFLATITLGAMSFGFVGCSPAGAIRTLEEFKELRTICKRKLLETNENYLVLSQRLVEIVELLRTV